MHGVATPVTVPDVAARWWVALMSMPTESRSGAACIAEPERPQGLGEHHRRAAVEQAVGLGVALDRHRRRRPAPRTTSTSSMPIFSFEAAHALGHGGDEVVDGCVPDSLLMASLCRPSDGRPRRPAARPPVHRLESPRARPTPTRPRLLLLDGHSLAYRAFFALPVENFSTTTGQHTNAVYGFTSMLINVLRDEQPTHVGVAFDKSRQTFRLEEYAEYKAKRNKTPDEFTSQLPLINEVLDALHIRHLEHRGLRGRRHHRHAGHRGARRRHRGADPHR